MRIVRLLLILLAVAGGIIGWAYRTAVSDPVVRHADIALLPSGSGSAPFRILLLSDIHVAGPDMTPRRLRRIVALANAQRPDAILIAGDFVSDKRLATRRFAFADAVAPLGDLRSRFGAFAVLGNHDHWRSASAARAALRAIGVRVLDNDAARAGPLVIGGLDDAFTGHDDLDGTLRAMARHGGEPVLLTHSPDPFPRVPSRVGLMLAGHTHCGQIRLPLLGALSYMSAYGDRYACGIVTERGKTLVVGAGVGTSVLPLRLGAVPDLWLLTLRPRPNSRSQSGFRPVCTIGTEGISVRREARGAGNAIASFATSNAASGRNHPAAQAVAHRAMTVMQTGRKPLVL